MARPRLVVLLMVPIGALAGLIALLLLPHGAPRGCEASPQPGQALALQAPAPPVAQPERVAQAPAEEGAPAPEPEAVLAAEDTAEAGAEEEIDFLPYPNSGEEDFAGKYGALSVADLYWRQHVLNEKLSALSQATSLARFDAGRYLSRAPIQEEGLRGDETEDWWWPDKPVGQGRVWRCSQGIPPGMGTPELRITYLTEAEYPELFAKLDETLYVARLWKQKEKATKQ